MKRARALLALLALAALLTLDDLRTPGPRARVPVVPAFVIIVAALTSWYAFSGPMGWRGPWMLTSWAWAGALFAVLAWSR